MIASKSGRLTIRVLGSVFDSLAVSARVFGLRRNRDRLVFRLVGQRRWRAARRACADGCDDGSECNRSFT